MRPLGQETNLEYLREVATVLTSEVENLQKEIVKLRSERDGMEGACAQAMLSQNLEDQLHRLQKKFFGFGREKLPGQSPRPVGHEGQIVLLHSWRAHPEGALALEKPLAPLLMPDAVAHDASPSVMLSESAARGVDMSAGVDAWEKMKNLTRDTVEITVTERIYKKVVHKQSMYRLKDEYNKTGKEVIITAPGPVKVKPGMTYSMDFALSVVTDKYEMHLPLERQRRKMAAAGLEVDVKTLYTLCEAVAEHCQTVLPQIKADIQGDYCAVHLDETPWRILQEKTLGQMWVMSNRMGVYYQFEPTRSGKIAAEMLKNYEGAIVTDAYGGYSRLAAETPRIRIQHCWAHARREFFERYDDFPDDCRKAVELIDDILELEYKFQSVEDCRKVRLTESKPAIDRLRDFLFETRPKYLPSQGLSKAINYCLNHWKGLTHFLTDVTVPLTNNDAERALRHVVVGRKNFLGSQTINGADTAAAIYTVIETAKKNSLQPTEYLNHLITERWHNRQPLSPKLYADRKFGVSDQVKWPARSDWKIEAVSQ